MMRQAVFHFHHADSLMGLALACFIKCRDLVYIEISKAEIAVIYFKSFEVCSVVPISGGAVI